MGAPQVKFRAQDGPDGADDMAAQSPPDRMRGADENANPHDTPSPSLYSPYKRPGNPYSPFNAGPLGSPVHCSSPGPLHAAQPAGAAAYMRQSLWANRRRVSTAASLLLTKIAGASTSQYDDYVPSPENASPRKRRRPPIVPEAQPISSTRSTGMSKTIASKVEAGSKALATVAAKPAAIVASAASGVIEASQVVANIDWGKEVRQELASAGQTISTAARATVQAVDDEADALFDNIEAHLGVVATKLRKGMSGSAAALRAAASTNSASLEAAGGDSAAGDDGEADSGSSHSSSSSAAAVPEDDRVAGASDDEEAASSSVVHGLQTAVTNVTQGLSAVEERLVAAESSLMAAGGELGGKLEGTLAAVGASVGEAYDAVEVANVDGTPDCTPLPCAPRTHRAPCMYGRIASRTSRLRSPERQPRSVSASVRSVAMSRPASKLSALLLQTWWTLWVRPSEA